MERLISLILIILFLFGCNNDVIYIDHCGKKDYTKIFRNAVSKSNHIIITTGSYYLSQPIYLHDNTTIEGDGEVILIKDSVYSHVFANDEAIKSQSKKIIKILLLEISL